MKSLVNIFRGKRNRPSEPVVSDPFEVFWASYALAINEARLCHLASLGLDLAGKRVLEVGGGIGLLTCFFENLGCSVMFTDGRPENVEEVKRRFPGRPAALLDLDHETDLSRLGTFDLVFCYGTLYHLSKPAEALRALSRVCREMILLETCVTPGDDDSLHPEQESAITANQAVSGLGCRPTRPWVMRQLRENFGYAYNTLTQPLYEDFELNWLKPAPRKNYRAIFVGSKRPISLPALSETLRNLQWPVPDDTRGIWVEVGTHSGESTFEQTRSHPGLSVYTFEPNLQLAARRFGILPNFTVVPLAVSEKDGFARLSLDTNSAAGSSPAHHREHARQGTGAADPKLRIEATLPTIRVDSFLKALGIAHVDCLNIDARGTDFSVVRSAGDKLATVRKIKMNVTLSSNQSDSRAGPKAEVVRYLTSKGFALVSEQPQSRGQEECLVFFRLGPVLEDLRPPDSDALGHPKT